MAKTIVITNQKGGCGKTTTAVHLATGLLRRTYRVLLIDADPQHTATNWIKNKERFNFKSIKANKQNLVNKIVDSENKNYDYIIVDCPPSFDSIVTYSALLVGDMAIIPLLCSANDLWALQKINDSIKEAGKVNKKLKSYILINQYRPRELLTQGIMAAVQDFGIPILLTKLGARNTFKESAAYGITVYNLKNAKAIEEVEELTNEVLSIIGEQSKNE